MRAAKQGYIPAQNDLGNYYLLGRGVEQNYKSAFNWFKLAAEQGHASAQYNLGILYNEGQGVAQSYEKAFQWFKLAAKREHALAKARLARYNIKEWRRVCWL